MFIFSDPAARSACCLTLHAISVHSPDSLKRHANEVMPLAFFAMHEEKVVGEDEKSNKNSDISSWEDVWNESTPGNSGVRSKQIVKNWL